GSDAPVAFHWTKIDPTAIPRLCAPASADDATRKRAGRTPRPTVGRAPGPGPTTLRSGTGQAGEVYVVGVDPAWQGRGLGGPVTRLGLAHLARAGCTEVQLYVDGDNAAARRTYARLGLTDVSVDGQYTPTSS
ncbi:MAG: GNAT family N-acetyltransferase, partial [Dermatophilaceae bacterium]